MKNDTPYHILAGMNLRLLIQMNYGSQEAFAIDYGADLRTINRYINDGINKIQTVQELAEFFNTDFTFFFQDHNFSEDT